MEEITKKSIYSEPGDKVKKLLPAKDWEIVFLRSSCYGEADVGVQASNSAIVLRLMTCAGPLESWNAETPEP